MGEELYERLKNMEFMDESYARRVFYQILDAINFIHKHSISHRDIKPENFVFEDSSSDNLKLIDFGLSSPFIPC
jgi:serine/threonine protein kinase